jgi:AGCS family alanine or glycine:cation symporter
MTLSLFEHIKQANELIWGLPLLVFVVATAVIMTCAFNFVQIRYFFTSWRYVFTPEQSATTSDAYITPLQAFVNALSASIGNGSTAGIATAVYYGGPGVGLWIFILGCLMPAVRFAEVYAGTLFIEKGSDGQLRGGPMVYLSKVPGGSVLPGIYAFFCLMLAFFSGNAMQCNSIAQNIKGMTGVDVRISAFILFGFVFYLMVGGARRIMRAAELIIPIKVGLFFLATLVVLFYHYAAIIPAIKLIITAGLTPKAVTGALMGLTVQGAIRYGMARSLNATEVGIGTAALLFGATASTNPKRSGIMSLASAFLSYHMVSAVLVVVLVASGVWNTGLNGTLLTQAAYATAFGAWGKIIVTFLSMTFGMGVLVAYAFMGRECWNYLFKGRLMELYTILYCVACVVGAILGVGPLFDTIDIVVAGLLITNFIGLLYLLPQLRRMYLAS